MQIHRSSPCLPTAVLLLAALAAGLAAAETLRSPNGRLTLTTRLDEGFLSYQLDRDDAPFLLQSRAGLRWNGSPQRWSSLSATREEQRSTWKPIWGKRASVTDHYRELKLELSTGEDDAIPLSVVFRLYDEGLAFRYRLGHPHGGPDSLAILADDSEFNFATDGTAWSYNGERENKGPESLSQIEGTRRTSMTIRCAENTYATIAEADLDNFPWIDLDSEPGSTALTASLEKCTVPLPFDTPWRVVIIGDRPGDLVDASLLENLNPPCAIKDPSWVVPGVTLWDWRTWGYKAPDGFVYGLDMASWRRFIDFAAKTGVPYLLLDANWYGPEFDPKEDPTTSRDHLVEQNAAGKVIRKPAPPDWADPIDIPALINYGKKRKVGLFLYINDKARINFDFERSLATYRDWGAAGIKYGFMSSRSRQQKVNKTNEIIRLCAKYQLMCNFHDGPVPPNGDYRTWPNCTTREFCHAQADAKRSFTPSTFNTTVFVNMITGPIDMNNGMFALDSAHESRPRVFQQIPSTLTGECARTLITFSGQTIIVDAPEYFAAHPEPFAFLAAQKQPWLESETLDGKIGEFIVMRRSARDGTILLAATTNEQSRTLDVPLPFLGNESWQATILQDAPDAAYNSQRETYRCNTRNLTGSDTLSLKLAPGGGACVRFENPRSADFSP